VIKLKQKQKQKHFNVSLVSKEALNQQRSLLPRLSVPWTELQTPSEPFPNLPPYALHQFYQM
jgi:hypothetical protein